MLAWNIWMTQILSLKTPIIWRLSPKVLEIIIQKRKVLIVLNDMIADVISNERVHCVFTEIFLGIDFRKCAPPHPLLFCCWERGWGCSLQPNFQKVEGGLDRISISQFLRRSGQVVKMLDSQSRGPVFKTTRWLQG